MTADRRPPSNGIAAPLHPLAATLPIGAFTASVLFDVLSFVADDRTHADAYKRNAAELLTVGLGAVVASLGRELAEDLLAAKAPAAPETVRRLALNGGAIAIYLLDVAARRKPSGQPAMGSALGDALPIGLSILGLTLLGLSGK